MNVYSLAAEVLGDLELSADQRARLRAIDYRHQLEVQRRLQARAGREGADGGAPAQASDAAAEAGQAVEDLASRRAALVAEIRELLTPEQRAMLDRR